VEILRGEYRRFYVFSSIEFFVFLGLSATAQALLTAIYGGLGFGAGTLAAGFIYKQLGPENLFFGAICYAFLALIVFSVSSLIPRKRERMQARIAINTSTGGIPNPRHESLRNIALPAEPMEAGPILQPDMVTDNFDPNQGDSESDEDDQGYSPIGNGDQRGAPSQSRSNSQFDDDQSD
jgi:hypothetical protein